MSRFDPTPGEPYGKCQSCDLVMETQDESRQHMSETFDAGRSHSIRITNPDRATRIRREIDRVVDDALYDAMEALDRLTGRGDLTDDEVATALRSYPDFSDAWDEHVREGE